MGEGAQSAGADGSISPKASSWTLNSPLLGSGSPPGTRDQVIHPEAPQIKGGFVPQSPGKSDCAKYPLGGAF